MAKKGGYDWLRAIDWFAKPIGLRLDRNQDFATPSGGCLSLITGLLILIYLTIVGFNDFGKFYTETELVNLSTNFTSATYEVEGDKILFQIAIGTSDFFKMSDRYKYFDVVYQQV